MRKPLKGIWIDDSPSRVLAVEYLDELKDLGIHTAAIMIEDVIDGRRVWTAEQIHKAAFSLRQRDIEVVLTCAPAPSRQYLDGLFEFLDSIVHVGISAVEADKEGRWKGRPRGFKTLQDASDYYVAGMRGICEPFDIRLELTTHPGHPEHTAEAMTAPRVDRLIGQWYSVKIRNRKKIDWRHKYGPGRMQILGARRWETIPKADGKPQLAIGLAAWSQEWPEHTAHQAMQVAYGAACQNEPVEIRWWSSKFILGSKRNGYAAKFIRSI